MDARQIIRETLADIISISREDIENAVLALDLESMVQEAVETKLQEAVQDIVQEELDDAVEAAVDYALS